MRDIPLDTDNEDELGLIVNVEVTLLAGSAGQADLLTLSVAVLLNVGLSALEDNATLLLVGLYESKSVQRFHNVFGDIKHVWYQIYQTRKMVNRRQHRPIGLVAWLVLSS